MSSSIAVVYDCRPARRRVTLMLHHTEREEKTAVAIASNDSFSGWTKTFTDPRLCAAIVDRLTFGGNIIKTGTTSYPGSAVDGHMRPLRDVKPHP
jgi:hypothetical protein